MAHTYKTFSQDAMSIGSFLVAFFLIRYLRNALQTPTQLPWWDKILVSTRWAVIALLLLEVFLPVEAVTAWLWHVLLLLMMGILYRQSEFRPVRTVLYAIAPYILISLFSDLLAVWDPDLYESWDNYIGSALFFAFLWMVAMWLNMQKQQKALEEERQKTQVEAEQRRVVESRSEELEHLVAERTAEITQQKEELQQAFTVLKAIQDQLNGKTSLSG